MNLHQDKFVIKLSSKYQDVVLPNILEKLPEKYHMMFSLLWNHFQNISDIIDSRNSDQAFKILYENKINVDDCPFSGPYREKDCLLQILRSEFFDTLMVFQNVYSPYGITLFHVLEKDQIIRVTVEEGSDVEDFETDQSDNVLAKVSVEDLISEKRWGEELPLDQRYKQSPIVNMREDRIDPIRELL